MCNSNDHERPPIPATASAVVDPKFAEAILKDCLDAMHKSAANRLAAIGIFSALVAGVTGMAFYTRTIALLAFGAVLLVLLLRVEHVMRRVQQSYNFRYIQIASQIFGRPEDCLWLTAGTPTGLIVQMKRLALAPHGPFEEQSRQLRAVLSSWRHISFVYIVFVIAIAYAVLLAFATVSTRWTFM